MDSCSSSPAFCSVPPVLSSHQTQTARLQATVYGDLVSIIIIMGAAARKTDSSSSTTTTSIACPAGDVKSCSDRGRGVVQEQDVRPGPVTTAVVMQKESTGTGKFPSPTGAAACLLLPDPSSAGRCRIRSGPPIPLLSSDPTVVRSRDQQPR
ncbi:hypothetical protein ABZP36_025987 [Zizania latifolia]